MPILQEGQSVRETYEVERYLGEGAFAEVYRVKHRFLGRQAMKVFKARGMTVGDIQEVLNEAVLLSRIGHPNIVRVFDANTIDTARGSYGFFTMEYVAGGSLDRYWQSHGSRLMTIDVAVEITIQACRGLSAAHGEIPPIIHRDIKPQNLLIGYDGAGLRVRITDFGLAKQVNPLTMLASARGTLLFKAPETVSDFHQDSTSGDVWALGTTLYLLSTDQLPYPPDPRDVSVEPKRFDKALVPAHTFNIRIDPHLEAILTRSLARDPRDRYPHAMAFLQDLEAWSAARTDRIAAPSAVMAQQTSKDALGHHDAANEGQARSKAQKARDLARQAATIGEAADLLEEALAQWPPLKDEYEYELKLWRRGVAM